VHHKPITGEKTTHKKRGYKAHEKAEAEAINEGWRVYLHGPKCGGVEEPRQDNEGWVSFRAAWLALNPHCTH
jgi:hypothetical protein